MENLNLETVNQDLEQMTPPERIRWMLQHLDGTPMVSTNFRPFEAVMLHLLVQERPDIPVLWVDHGYNTPATYTCAEACIEQLKLNVKLYVPRRSSAHRDTVLGGIPSINEEEKHNLFTEEVKLEPFRRGLAELKPGIWFTALRRVQNPNRESMDMLSRTGEGLWKASPLLDWTDEQMQEYIDREGLPNEFNYYDPTKVLEKRECGLHLDSAKL